MTDLCKRLRDASESIAPGQPDITLYGQAATELERLQARVAELEATLREIDVKAMDVCRKHHAERDDREARAVYAVALHEIAESAARAVPTLNLDVLAETAAKALYARHKAREECEEVQAAIDRGLMQAMPSFDELSADMRAQWLGDAGAVIAGVVGEVK